MITLFMNREIITGRKYLNMHVANLRQKLIYINFYFFYVILQTVNGHLIIIHVYHLKASMSILVFCF